MSEIAITIFYLAGAVLFFGMAFARYQRKFAIIAKQCRREDAVFCGLMAILWPLTLPMGLLAWWAWDGHPFNWGILFPWSKP